MSIRRVDSSTSGPLISSPSWAPRPVPTSSAVGVASPSAQGQAMISTATAAVKAKLAPAPSAEPEAEGADGERDHDRDEDGADPVGQPLHRRLARLRLGDEAGDLRQRRVLADPGGADDEAAADVDRRADHLLPGPDFDRHRLAGDQRLVDRRGAALDDAVGRDLLPRPDDEAVADRELLDRDPPLAAVGVEQGDVLGAEVEQRLQRRAGPALGPCLEVAAGEDEGGDDGGDLEVDLVGAGAALGDQLERHLHPVHPGVAEEERVQRPAERGQGPDRDQGVHRHRAVAQVLPGGLVEGPARPEHHRRRQLQREPLPVFELQRLDHRQQPAPAARGRRRRSAAGAGPRSGRLRPPRPPRRRRPAAKPRSRPPPPRRAAAPARPARGRTRRVARSVAKLTVASTPSSLLRLFSTRPAQEEQVIPSIGSSSRSSVAGRSFVYPIGV